MNDYADLPHIFPTVVDLLADAAHRAPHHPALEMGEETLTYSDYLSCVAGFAQELRDLGTVGERVALVMGNSIDIAIAMFGAHAAGAQVVPLNPMYTARELGEILVDAEPHVVVYDDAAAPHVKPLLAECRIAVGLHIGQEGGRRLTAWAGQQMALPQPLPQPDQLATLQYTGGTTGLPKGVNITHGQIALNIAQREALLPTRPEQERLLCVMPMFHVYAVAMALHLTAYCRGTLVILPRYRPDWVLEALEQRRITLFPGSPTIYTGLMQYEGFAETDFSALRLCYSGAERLPEDTLKAWEQATGCTTLEGFGQSEAGPVLSFNPEHGAHKALSVGHAVPHTEIEIVDIETGAKTLPAREPGEIRARGPQLMSGYRNRSEETAETLRDGWLYTGDLGYLDEEGYLFIVGRKKEMVIVGGFNVYPREIEELLCAHEEILEAAVVGAPDDYRGEQLRAYVGLRPASQLDEEQLRAYCTQNLVKYKVPAVFEIMTALPRTTVGKIDKKALVAQASTGAGKGQEVSA